MSGFIVFRKLTVYDAIDTMIGIEKFFRENPSRKVCRTDLFEIRRGHIVEDILKHTEPIEKKP